MKPRFGLGSSLGDALREIQHVIGWHLHDDFFGVAVNHTDNRAMSRAVKNEDQFVLTSQRLGAVDGMSGFYQLSALGRVLW